MGERAAECPWRVAPDESADRSEIPATLAVLNRLAACWLTAAWDELFRLSYGRISRRPGLQNIGSLHPTLRQFPQIRGQGRSILRADLLAVSLLHNSERASNGARGCPPV